jgi:hypothetical protein
MCSTTEPFQSQVQILYIFREYHWKLEYYSVQNIYYSHNIIDWSLNHLNTCYTADYLNI